MPGLCFFCTPDELWLIIGVLDSKSGLYTLNEVKAILNAYITSNQLMNARDQAYVNLNEALLVCISSKSGKKAGKDASSPEAIDTTVGSEFMKREELLKRVMEQMQSWHEIRVEGQDIVTKYVPFSSFPPCMLFGASLFSLSLSMLFHTVGFGGSGPG